MKSNLRKHICLSIFWIVLGITLIILSRLEFLDGSLYSGIVFLFRICYFVLRKKY